MDQSSRQLAIVNAYGGSDRVEASLNAPKYVRFGSVHAPRDFGILDNASLDVKGLVGAQSGTQTLFFRVTTKEACRLGIRKVPINRYTDQYISIGLSSEVDGPIALQEDFTVDIEAARIDLGYVTCDYWSSGYCELDCQFTELEIDAPSFQETSYLGNTIHPPGAYVFTVSSSQWPKLPYHIQLAVSTPTPLAGIAIQATDVRGSLALKSLATVISMESAPKGVVGTVKSLTSRLSGESRPQATVQRTSPFG